MKKYLCSDGHSDEEITSTTARSAAQFFVDAGDWSMGSSDTITVRVAPVDSPEDAETIECKIRDRWWEKGAES